MYLKMSTVALIWLVGVLIIIVLLICILYYKHLSIFSKITNKADMVTRFSCI